MVKAVLALALTLFLSGCGDGRELAECRARLDAQRGEMEAKIAELERRAAVAQACDYLIPLCPASMTAPGREALQYGYSGGGALFWALVLAKLVALLIPGCLAGGAAGWAWARWSAPALDEAEAARRMVDEAESQAARARQAAAQAAEQARQAKVEAEAWARAAAAARAEAEAAAAEAQRARAVRDALTGL